ncbi:MAG: adenosylcobinamide-GDP ribazoletransferase [Candidatus Binatus sp.]|uniref:adenosylcobinamide-GDP ribazoletransferase n=1 Tax=Candidatus Binatus sp. TaxID=2811406 RepID=UPI0027276481|nr:adenosylcobinamide-GDP ribazoletransferase [Candidatus Binatus sp.]MDO8430874.1 adenosylcobinamide-GDP ribazoletransferase [Candidatus Binatus sp.]
MIDDDGAAPISSGVDAAPTAGFLAELQLAFSFLTILPVIDRRPASDATVTASFTWFPLVGLTLGAALCGVDWILAHVLGQVMRSVIVILFLTIITGAVHLDGLADTADALGAGRDRERALEIMRDSRLGTFGALAVFFDLSLKILALSTLTGSRRYDALIVAPMLARLAMLAIPHGMAYLRERGAGSVLLARRDIFDRRLIAALAAILLAALIGGFRTVLIAVAVVLATRWFYRRWLGGVTGDLIGAGGELVEIALLVAMTM